MAETSQSPKHESGTTRKPTAFLQRHRTVFPVIGALIVFTTFVINEELLEHLRGMVEAIESAKTAFRVTGENSWNRWTVLQVEEHVDLMRLTIRPTGPATKEEL